MWAQAGVLISQVTELAWPILVKLAFDALVILAAAILACAYLRRASAAARHRVWALAAVSLLALPVVRLSVPNAPLVLWAAPQPERTGESSEANGGASEPADVAASAARAHRPKADVLATDATVPGASADGFMDNPAGTLPGRSSAVSEPAQNKALWTIQRRTCARIPSGKLAWQSPSAMASCFGGHLGARRCGPARHVCGFRDCRAAACGDCRTRCRAAAGVGLRA